MQVVFHNNKRIAEIVSPDVLIANGQDAIELIYHSNIEGADAIILHSHNLADGFLTLSTGIAGDVLQKFTNYRCQLAIVGPFENVVSKSLADFIRESNKGRLIYFANSVSEAVTALSR